MRGRFLLLLAAPAAILAQENVPRGDTPTDVVPRHLSEVSYLGASECYDADPVNHMFGVNRRRRAVPSN